MNKSKVINACPLKDYVSIKAGGNADKLIIPRDIEELVETIKELKREGVPYYLLGNGSNTLFSDKGFRGAVVVTTELNQIKKEDITVTAQCGATLNALALFCANHSLEGVEYLFGIPGTVGGGVFMNAGAFCGEIKDTFVKGTCLFFDDLGETVIRELTREEMEFGYRKSSLAKNNGILLDATFELSAGNKKIIKEKMNKYMGLRKQKQPLEYPSCGSVFKRPEGHYAGALIEQCGLKGYSIGGAQVSTKHAGFIINKNNASADDVIALIKYVSDTVYDKTGVRLEPEVRII